MSANTLTVQVGDQVSYQGPTHSPGGVIDGDFTVLEIGDVITLRDARYDTHFAEQPAGLYVYTVPRAAFVAPPDPEPDPDADPAPREAA